MPLAHLRTLAQRPVRRERHPLSVAAAPHNPVVPCMHRLEMSGKFFRAGTDKWYLKGFTYGPFAPNEHGVQLPVHRRLRQDLAQMRELGANCIRVYHVPPRHLLDLAQEQGLRVFVDVPWEKHRCFFEDWSSQQDARRRVRSAARELADHPALMAISVANELPADVARFYGHRRVERFVDELMDSVKQVDAGCLTTSRAIRGPNSCAPGWPTSSASTSISMTRSDWPLTWTGCSTWPMPGRWYLGSLAWMRCATAKQTRRRR